MRLTAHPRPYARRPPPSRPQSGSQRRLMAVGGEEGDVDIFSTAEFSRPHRRPDTSNVWEPIAHWPAHKNTIFDLAWAKVRKKNASIATICSATATSPHRSSHAAVAQAGLHRHASPTHRVYMHCRQARARLDKPARFAPAVLACMQGESRIYTASGNMVVGIWDTSTAQMIAFGEGHTASVRSVSALTTCEDVFATGEHGQGCAAPAGACMAP